MATKKPAPAEAPEYPDHINDLVREYANLQADADPILARMEEIKKTLRFDLTYGTHKIAGLSVSVARNSRLSASAFADAYPVMKYPNLYKPAPDSAAIKENLAPTEIKKYTTEGDPRVSIK